MEGEGENDARIAETDTSELCRGVGGLDILARLPYLQLVIQGLLLQEICVCSGSLQLTDGGLPSLSRAISFL